MILLSIFAFAVLILPRLKNLKVILPFFKFTLTFVMLLKIFIYKPDFRERIYVKIY